LTAFVAKKLRTRRDAIRPINQPNQQKRP
jgi:hypothetical protein